MTEKLKNKETVEPVIRYEETVIPKYVFKEKIMEIPVLVEKKVESISKDDLDLIRQYAKELDELFKKIREIKNYKITEEQIKIKNPVFIDTIVKNPVFHEEHVTIKKYKETEQEVKVPIFVEKRIETISDADLRLIKEMVIQLKNLSNELSTLRNYKIKEETYVIEKPIYKPKVVEIEQEKVNWVINDLVIETLDDLVSKLKKKEGGLK